MWVHSLPILDEEEVTILLCAITFGERSDGRFVSRKLQQRYWRDPWNAPPGAVHWQDLISSGLLLAAYTLDQKPVVPHFLLIKRLLEAGTRMHLADLWLDLHNSLTADDGDFAVFKGFHIQLEAVRGHLFCSGTRQIYKFIRNDQIGTAITLEERYPGALFYPKQEANRRLISFSGARVHIGHNSKDRVCSGGNSLF